MALARTHAPAKRKPTGEAKRGTGSGSYTVKHHRATRRQREVIDEGLARAQRDRASRRVMIATVMAMTQESVCGEAMQKTGNDDTGILQQGRNWISAAESRQAGPAVHAFLVTGPTSWKKVHGGLKKAPGNLSHAIHEVQGNQDPNAYAPWEEEATRTVETWLSHGGSELAGGSYVKQYVFTRGEKGGSRESSWDAMARLVGEVGAYRWAAGNVLYAASGDELRQQAPSLTIRGDEGWLVKQPSWSWATSRAISEITLDVLADRWDVLPGGCVVLPRDYGAMQGKWLVWNVSGTSLVSPEATIVLRRPTRLKSEPPSERATRPTTGGGEFGGVTGEGAQAVLQMAKQISGRGLPYAWGGGHPHCGTPSRSTRPGESQVGFDCSGYVAACLAAAGWGFRKGQGVPSSGAMAASWGDRGRGRELTVYANGEHVWIEFADGSRADTSAHSCGESGARYRRCKRNDHGRFTARHWPGH